MRCLPFLVGFSRKAFLFCDQKRKRKKSRCSEAAAWRRSLCAAKRSPLGTPKGWSSAKKAKKRRSAALFLTLFRPSPIDPSGAKITLPHPVGADARHRPAPGRCLFAGRCKHHPLQTAGSRKQKSRNFVPSHCRVLAPGRGQSVRSWVLRGALAKRSRKARTKAPLSRASRAIGSSGHLFGSFWVSKRNTWRKNDANPSAPPQGGGKRRAPTHHPQGRHIPEY